MKIAPESMPSGKAATMGKVTVSGAEPNLNFYLRELIKRGGSDLHLKVGRPPLFRIRGDLLPTEFPTIGKKDMEDLLLPILNPIQREKFETSHAVDLGYGVPGVARVGKIPRADLDVEVLLGLPLHEALLQQLEGLLPRHDRVQGLPLQLQP